MGVTMSHRFDQDKSTLRAEIRSGACGTLDYLVCRFTCDARKFGTWGRFRHEMVDPLLWEGAVHHLDLLADMAGAPAETVYAQTWNPSWGEYTGDSQALVTMQCGNGVRISYEGAKCNAVGLNQWGEEYVRAECERGTLIMANRQIRRFRYAADASWRAQKENDGELIDLLSQPKWTNTWLIEKFARWVGGGPAMETEVEANLQSVAIVSAAVESSRIGRPVRVQEHLAAARAAAAS
jgi:predicted dehydrogenase